MFYCAHRQKASKGILFVQAAELYVRAKLPLLDILRLTEAGAWKMLNMLFKKGEWKYVWACKVQEQKGKFDPKGGM